MSFNAGKVDPADRISAAAEVIRKIIGSPAVRDHDRPETDVREPTHPMGPYLHLRANAAGIIQLSFDEILALNRFISGMPHFPAGELRQAFLRALPRAHKIAALAAKAELSKKDGAPFSETLIPFARDAREMLRTGREFSLQDIVLLLNAFRADTSDRNPRNEAWLGLFSQLDAQAASFYREAKSEVAARDLLLLPEVVRKFNESSYFPRLLVEEVSALEFREVLSRLRFWAIIELADAIWELDQVPARLATFTSLQSERTFNAGEVDATVKFARALVLSEPTAVANLLQKSADLLQREELLPAAAATIAIAASICGARLPDALWAKLYQTWEFLDQELKPGMVMSALQGALNNLCLRFALSHPIGPYRVDCAVFNSEDPAKFVALQVSDDRFRPVANVTSASLPGAVLLRKRYLEFFGVQVINLPLSRWMPLSVRSRTQVLERLFAGQSVDSAFEKEED